MNDLGMERKSPFSRLQWWIRRAAGGGADSYWVVGVGGKLQREESPPFTQGAAADHAEGLVQSSSPFPLTQAFSAY